MPTLDGEAVKAALAQVKDPLFDRDVVALGYVKKVDVSDGKAAVELSLPTPAHPHRAALEAEVAAAAKGAGAAEVALDVKWDVSTRLRAGSDRLAGV
jgi:metal-sulfur cluster biosynthetic enzyme